MGCGSAGAAGAVVPALACAGQVPPPTRQMSARAVSVICDATPGVAAAAPAAIDTTPAMAANHSTDVCPRSRMRGTLSAREALHHGPHGSSSRLGGPGPR